MLHFSLAYVLNFLRLADWLAQKPKTRLREHKTPSNKSSANCHSKHRKLTFWLLQSIKTFTHLHKNDRDNGERPPGQEGAGQVQRGRHDRRPQEADRGADGHALGQDRAEEVVHHLQGPHLTGGLRDTRRNEPRTVLPVIDWRKNG